MPTVSEESPRTRSSRPPTLLQPGHNCWRVERATRFSCIQDAAEYFRLVRHAILQARDTIFILGWDIQATLDLMPGGTADDAPTRLDELLIWVVRRRPGVRCYILIWDYAPLYALERDPFTRWRFGWRMPRQVRFGFDDHHPIGGSHHQKVVVIDDELALCGGIDLTSHRWDTPAHRVQEPNRINAGGTPYGPYHEIQAMVDGPVAATLGTLVRDRWHALGERPRPCALHAPRGAWPEDIEPDLTDVDVAIVRTMPPSERDLGIRECERLFLDSIAAAEQSIYIESQYFTNETLTRALADRLQEADGPEVIAVLPKECHGGLEQQTMWALRHEPLATLVAADRCDRLRIVYPAASRTYDVPTFVHSKVMIVDDRLVRIGSANFSRRSMGVDSECDLAADAGAHPGHRAGVRRIRDRLLGEHLGMAPDAIAGELAHRGSMRALVDARAQADRTLLPIDLSTPLEAPAEVLKTAADPDEPVDVGSVTDVIPPLDARADRGSIRVWLRAVAIGAAWLVVGRTLMNAGEPLSRALLAPQRPSVLWAGVAVLLLAHLAFVPLEILAVVAGVVFGPTFGGLVALAGASTAAIVGYGVGRAIGAPRLASWVSRRGYRAARQLGTRGVVGVAVLRLTSITSGGSVHLVCGAARAPLRTYLIGSAVGLTPMMIVLAGVGSLLQAAFVRPSWSSGFLAAAGVLAACALAVGLRALLVARQFSPSVRRRRERAEFG